MRKPGQGQTRQAVPADSRQRNRGCRGCKQSSSEGPQDRADAELEPARRCRIADHHWINEPHRLPPFVTATLGTQPACQILGDSRRCRKRRRSKRWRSPDTAGEAFGVRRLAAALGWAGGGGGLAGGGGT